AVQADSGSNKLDRKAPQSSGCDSADGTGPANIVTLSLHDALPISGPGTQQVALSTHVDPGDETANAAASAGGSQACDAVGNCAASPEHTAGNKIHRKAPQPPGCETADGTWHANNVTLHCSYTDGGS